jgi:hypothetical protein
MYKLLEHFLSCGQRVSPEVRPVTVEDFRAGPDVLDGADDDPGPVKADKRKKNRKIKKLKRNKNKKLFY